MKVIAPTCMWKKYWPYALVAVLAVLIGIWPPGCEDVCKKELEPRYNNNLTEIVSNLQSIPQDPEDYCTLGRAEAQATTETINRLLNEFRNEHALMLNEYEDARLYFEQQKRPENEEHVAELMSRRERLNQYAAALAGKINSTRQKAQAEYEGFCISGIDIINKAWRHECEVDVSTLEPEDLIALSYMTKEEQEAFYRLCRLDAKQKAFSSECTQKGCQDLAKNNNSRRARMITPRLEALREMAARRRCFHNCNVSVEHQDFDSSFNPKANEQIIYKEVAGQIPNSERYNLCTEPHKALQSIEAYLGTLPSELPALAGTLLPHKNTQRDLRPENADFHIVTTADLDSSLIRHLIRSWAKGQDSPFGEAKSAITFDSPTKEAEKSWFIVKQVPGENARHKEFPDEFWVYIHTLGSKETAADYLRQPDAKMDLLITGDAIPDGAWSKERLCSDAILFVDCSKGSQGDMVLNSAQMRGEGTQKLKRVFFPENSPQRRLSDLFKLTPGAGDMTLPDTDEATLGKLTDGALIIPWHLCNSNMRIYALALPAIKDSGKLSAAQRAEKARLGRPLNASYHPEADTIRSQKYSLSYHIHICMPGAGASELGGKFRDHCLGAEGQNCVQQRNYIPLLSTGAIQYRLLSEIDVPVADVIKKLVATGAPLGYTESDKKLLGYEISNVAYFNTNEANPAEITLDASEQKNIQSVMENLLSKGTIREPFMVVVLGHADERGNMDHNTSLSQKRAVCAVRQLIYTVKGGERVKGTGNDKEISHYKGAERAGLTTLGCSVWRPLTEENDRAQAMAAKAAGNDEEAGRLLQRDRRVEFFIIVPKSDNAGN